MSSQLLEQGKQALEKLPENYLPFLVHWLESLAENTEAEDFWLLIGKAIKQAESDKPKVDWKTYLKTSFPEQVGTWQEIRELHPHSWLLVEALDGSTVNSMREITILRICAAYGDDWKAAWEKYKILHRANKYRELYVLHTDRLELEIEVRYR